MGSSFSLCISWRKASLVAHILRSKNTCVDHTQVFVLQKNTTLISYMKDGRLCWLNTSTCVGLTKKNIVWHVFQRTYELPTANEGWTYDPHATKAGVLSSVLSLTRLTMTLFFMLIVTLAIMYVNVKFSYINMSTHK